MGTGWRLFPVDSGCTFDQMKAWTDGLTGRETALANGSKELASVTTMAGSTAADREHSSRQGAQMQAGSIAAGREHSRQEA